MSQMVAFSLLVQDGIIGRIKVVVGCGHILHHAIYADSLLDVGDGIHVADVRLDHKARVFMIDVGNSN